MKTIKNAMKYNPNKKIGNNNLGSMVSLLRVKARRTSKIHI